MSESALASITANSIPDCLEGVLFRMVSEKEELVEEIQVIWTDVWL